jgi:glutamate 5-kinase
LELLEHARHVRRREPCRVAAGDAVEVVCDGDVVGKGIVNYSAGELARIKGLKSTEVAERLPDAAEEAVHRNYFVLT